uniref:RNA-dependent RNA polymerase n=1 Tax=Baoshan Mitov tick virus 1 TaxID=2972214 RepID=A0A9E7V1X6_9VIRU|nr:MAG: RNA-dependent RNA polymerase [Baoshan Mitov tick virus 1]
MLRNKIKIIKRLCSIFFQEAFQPQHFTKLLYLYSHLVKHHGYTGAIKYMKNMRLHCTRYICGHPLKTNTNGIGLDKDGWPIKLEFLKESVNNGKLSYVLTILMFNRSIDLPNKERVKNHMKTNYKTITDGPRSKYTIPTGFIKKFVKDFNLKLSEEELTLNPTDFYLSNKGGPQGKATLTAHRSWLTFDDKFIERLKGLCVGGFALSWIEKSRKFWTRHKSSLELTPLTNVWSGKFSLIDDPEAKVRVIAIVDYYTQLLLKKLHQAQFRVIKNFNCDRTFTQNPHHSWDSSENQYWSLDLSSATDRFPRTLQMRLIGEMFNYNFAKTWSEHLGSIEFANSDQTAELQYGTGQPMGTYSSWISFTLAHHLVVHWCAHLEGVSNFDQYIILGDDIVIKHDKIAKRYIKVIEKLGVDISLSKTHVSKDTYEFAKRWIKGPIEITGLPSRGIISNFKSPNIVFTILYDFYKIKKNTYTSSYSLVESMGRLYSNFYLLQKSSKKNIYNKLFIRFNRKIRERLLDFNTVLDFSFGYEDSQKLSQLFARKLYPDEKYKIPTTMKSLRTIIGIGLKSRIVDQIQTLDSLKSGFNKMDFKIPDPMRSAHIKLHLVWPLYNGVRNEVQHLYKGYNQKIDNNNMSIYDYISEIRIIDFKGIYEKQRQKYSDLITIGSTMERGFSEVNKYIKANTNSPFMGNTLGFINILANAHFDMKWDSQKKKFNDGWNPTSLIGNLT